MLTILFTVLFTLVMVALAAVLAVGALLIGFYYLVSGIASVFGEAKELKAAHDLKKADKVSCPFSDSEEN